MTKKVLVTDYVWTSVDPERAVLARADTELVLAPDGEEETLIELARQADGILTCFAKVTENVIKAASQCVVIGRYGVGVDNIAVDSATDRGIVVTYVPDYCIDEVSDHVMALLLSWNRRISLFDNATKSEGWGAKGLGMRIMRLRGKKLGVVGFGRIGQSVCAKARAFGFDVLAHDPLISKDMASRHGAALVDFNIMLRESDFITLHLPLLPQTRHIIGEAELKQMKPDTFIINAARGGLIDEDALYHSLATGEIAGAGLDVVEDAIPPLNHRLIQLENVIVTPHTAFFSQEAVLELEERAAGEVARVLSGELPENIVNPEVLSHSRATLPSP